MLLSTLLERVIQDERSLAGKQHVVHNEVVSGISADRNYGYEIQVSNTAEGQSAIDVVRVEAGKHLEKKTFSREDFVNWLKNCMIS